MSWRMVQVRLGVQAQAMNFEYFYALLEVSPYPAYAQGRLVLLLRKTVGLPQSALSVLQTGMSPSAALE